MRLIPIAAMLLLAVAGCSNQSESGTPAANADALADTLEARADNLEMMADDDAVNSDAAMAMENSADSLDQQSANLRAEASPKDRIQ